MNELEFSYFREVARTLNFSKAAERLYLTQSALSRSIAKIEKEYGAQLFVRDKHDVQLTAAGIALFNTYPQIQRAERLVREAVSDAAHGTHTRLNIGIQEGQLITDKLKHMLKEFEAQNPNVQMTVVSLLYTDLFDELNSHTIDIALSLEFADNVYTDIDSKLMEKRPSYALISSDHPAAKEKNTEKALSMLSGTDLMMVDWTIVPNVTSFIVNQCQENGINPANVRYAPSYQTLYSWITMEYGFVLMNREGSIFNGRDICFLPLSKETSMSFMVYWNKNITTRAIPKLVDHLTKQQ